MLKKLTSALLCLCLLAGLGAIFVSAEISDRVLDESWNDLKLSVLLDITVQMHTIIATTTRTMTTI